MKFLHLADLHLGKKINEYPLKEDQSFVLDQALNLAKKEKVDAIIIAGDVYDSSAPSAETMNFYDDFLTKLHHLGLPVLMISGNHDSPERLGVASSILKESGIHIVTDIRDSLKPIVVGQTHFYLLPYFRCSDVNHAFDVDCHGYEEALKELFSRMEIDSSKSNVLVAHLPVFPVGAKLSSSGSESALDLDAHGDVAGSEIVDIRLFGSFDYLALGHIHKAQNVAHNARYPGALLKYHVKEADAKRSFTIVEVNGKDISIREHPLHLLRDVKVLRGTLAELLACPDHHNDFVRCALTDEAIVDSPYDQLKAVFPYCLGIDYVTLKHGASEEAIEGVEEMDRTELFARFFSEFGGRPLDEKEKEYVASLLEPKEGKK